MYIWSGNIYLNLKSILKTWIIETEIQAQTNKKKVNGGAER